MNTDGGRLELADWIQGNDPDGLSDGFADVDLVDGGDRIQLLGEDLIEFGDLTEDGP